MNPAVSPLQGLVSYFQSLTAPLDEEELGECLRTTALNLEDVNAWMRFDDHVYCRNQIAKFPHIELLLLCWRSGQLTAIHDHAGSVCGVKVLTGTATEIRYSQSEAGFLFPAKTTSFEQGSIVSSYDQDIHQLGNLASADVPLVTLHAYSPPLKRCQIYDESTTYFAGYREVYSTVSERMSGAPAN